MYNKSNRKLGKRWTKADEQRLIEKAKDGRLPARSPTN